MLEREFLAKNKTVIMPQPLYSPDLTPANFFLLPKLKSPMQGQRVATIKEIKKIEAEIDTKKRISEVFRGLEKTLA